MPPPEFLKLHGNGNITFCLVHEGPYERPDESQCFPAYDCISISRLEDISRLEGKLPVPVPGGKPSPKTASLVGFLLPHISSVKAGTDPRVKDTSISVISAPSEVCWGDAMQSDTSIMAFEPGRVHIPRINQLHPVLFVIVCFAPIMCRVDVEFGCGPAFKRCFDHSTVRCREDVPGFS